MRDRFRRSIRAADRRTERASLRARLRTPYGIAEPIIERTKTAANTARDPNR